MPSAKRVKRRIGQHIANLNDPDNKVSSNAEWYLIRYYGIRAFEPLVEACSHPNPIVRLRAAWVLGHTHDPRAYETILRLTEDPDGKVRYDAAIALGILGDIRSVASLIALMSSPDDQSCIDSAAAMGLVRLGRPAVSSLLPLLQSGTPSLRRMAASVLGGIGDDVAIEPLATLLSDDEPDARIAGIEALAEIAIPRCRILIRGCLTDRSTEVQENASYWYEELARRLSEHSEC